MPIDIVLIDALDDDHDDGYDERLDVLGSLEMLDLTLVEVGLRPPLR